MTPESILVLDFGSQYTQLIARRVREARVYCEIHPHTLPLAEIAARRPRGIVLSGGPASVHDPGAPEADAGVFELGIPCLAICYGMQLMTRLLGGRVARSPQREYGPATVEVTAPGALFAGLPRRLSVWMSHGDRILAPPPGFSAVARSEHSPLAAIACEARRLYGVQFHPEVAHTPDGARLLANFLKNVCGCRGDWTPERVIDGAVARVRQTVGEGRAVCALSGGVDSSVAASLVHRALGPRLHCVFVDNGLLRQGEVAEVRGLLAPLGLQLEVVDASTRFLAALAGVTDPEQKRRRVGHAFIEVFEERARRLPGVTHLVQGTLYPDVIESISVRGPSATIKTHHNVGGLPERMALKLLEPLRELFKDEARAVGRALGLPEALIRRHPFPGPGLAVRILGEVTAERLEILRRADAIVREELEDAPAAARLPEIWQAFAVLLPVRTVGVMGDGRSYEHAVAVRAVGSQDGMTAHWVRLPYDVLDRLGRRIPNEVAGVNRVVYDLTSKPPGTIEWE